MTADDQDYDRYDPYALTADGQPYDRYDPQAPFYYTKAEWDAIDRELARLPFKRLYTNYEPKIFDELKGYLCDWAVTCKDPLWMNKYADGWKRLSLAISELERAVTELRKAASEEGLCLLKDFPFPSRAQKKKLQWLREHVADESLFDHPIGIREYYRKLALLWVGLGGRPTRTVTARPDGRNEEGGAFIRYLRAASVPVLREQALKPSSMKPLIAWTKRFLKQARKNAAGQLVFEEAASRWDLIVVKDWDGGSKGGRPT